MDDSFVFLAVHSSDDELDAAPQTSSQEEAKTFYPDWMESQPRLYKKMVCIILMDTFQVRFGVRDVVEATRQA